MFERGQMHSGRAKFISVVLAFILWYVLGKWIHNPILLAGPCETGIALLCLLKDVQTYKIIFLTLLSVIEGFLYGFIVGAALAILSYKYKIVNHIIWPYVSIIKTVPVASFVILCLVWFQKETLAVVVSFLMVMPVFYENLRNGLEHIDSKLLDMGKVFEINLKQRIKYIILPQLIPVFAAAIEIAAPMAWKSAIAAQVIAQPSLSIGKMLYYSKIYLETAELFAWTIIIILCSIVFKKGMICLMHGYIRCKSKRGYAGESV